MRILLLSQGDCIEDQPDFDKELRKAVCEGEKIELVNLPWRGYAKKHGSRAFYDEVLRLNEQHKPDLVFFQFFHGARNIVGDPTTCVLRLKASSNRPLIFGSVGDPFNWGPIKFMGRPFPSYLVRLALCADAMFLTAMGGAAEELVRFGAQNVIFLPNAFCEAHFSLPNPDDVDDKKYDVVVVCSYARIFCRRIWIGLTRGVSRCLLIRALHDRYGDKLGLFGQGWRKGLARGRVSFDDQVDAFRSGRVAVDIPAQINATYYTSDRAFFIAGSGTPLVMKYLPRLEKMLRSDENVYFAESIRKISDRCDDVLNLSPELLAKRRLETLKLIRERHTIARRMDTLLSTYEAIRGIRAGKMSLQGGLEHLRLWHFLPEVDLNEERKYAILNWKG